MNEIKTEGQQARTEQRFIGASTATRRGFIDSVLSSYIPDDVLESGKSLARIEYWSLLDSGSRLFGEIHHHPRQHEFLSQWQFTSRVVRIDVPRGYAETENTIYVLGVPASPGRLAPS